ncbi:MAG TPA: cytochrome B, partial [Gammaproteobacteria bacterium]|nr:cytochrome B [Gammaproteobacteria bacterium]
MRIVNSETRYGLVSKVLHWVIAFAVIGLICLGWYMVDLTYFDKWYNQSLAIHKALGLMVLGLVVVLFFWKIISPSPNLVASIPLVQRFAARGMHHLLMLVMTVISISGYLISTAAGKPV